MLVMMLLCSRGRLSDIVSNQAMQLRSSPAPDNSRPWR